MANINNMKTSSFHCPVGQCGKLIQLSISAVTAHIHEAHPGVNKNLGYPKTNGFCTECTSYTRSRHFHCRECSEIDRKFYFKSEIELTTHLKDAHTKWWFEFKCKHELGCYGLSGKCGFNHRITDKDFIDNEEAIPQGVCRNDRPWDGVRCTRTFCSYDHFRGRVKFLIIPKAKVPVAAAAAVSENAAADEYEEDFEADDAENDEKREDN